MTGRLHKSVSVPLGSETTSTVERLSLLGGLDQLDKRKFNCPARNRNTVPRSPIPWSSLCTDCTIPISNFIYCNYKSEEDWKWGIELHIKFSPSAYAYLECSRLVIIIIIYLTRRKNWRRREAFKPHCSSVNLGHWTNKYFTFRILCYGGWENVPLLKYKLFGIH